MTRGGEGCTHLSDSWEGVGLKPFRKFLYPRGPKVEPLEARGSEWKPRADRGIFHGSGSSVFTVVESLRNRQMSSFCQELSFCLPEGP